MTQADMARLLGVSRGTYVRYETRTGLPHHLVEEFAAITRVAIDDLYAAGDLFPALRRADN